MVTLPKEDFIAQRKHCFCIAACFVLLVTPYVDFICTCVTSNMWNNQNMKNMCKNQNKYLSWQIKLPLHSFALLYSVIELPARGRVLCALVMLQTLPDYHSHHYNVKTDITHALHLGCRIYMCSLNIISQILCIQQDKLCCHTSRVTCTLMSISNSDIINTNELSYLIDTKPFPWKKACPNNDCQRYLIFEWLGKHLLTLHHIDSKRKKSTDNSPLFWGSRERDS